MVVQIFGGKMCLWNLLTIECLVSIPYCWNNINIPSGTSLPFFWFKRKKNISHLIQLVNSVCPIIQKLQIELQQRIPGSGLPREHDPCCSYILEIFSNPHLQRDATHNSLHSNHCRISLHFDNIALQMNITLLMNFLVIYVLIVRF